MADNVYLIDPLALTGTVLVSDDGSGIDWMIVTGEAYPDLPGGVRLTLRLDLVDSLGGPAAHLQFVPVGGGPAVTFGIFGQIENALGGAGSDALWGSVLANQLQGDVSDVAGGQDVIYAGLGDDTLVGGGGSDRLYGGDGNDRFFGDFDLSGQDQGNYAQGDDSIYADAGNDTIHADAGNNVYDGGAGQDMVSYAGFFFAFETVYASYVDLNLGTALVTARSLFDNITYVVAEDRLVSVESAIGTDGADTMVARSTLDSSYTGQATFQGLEGDDTLRGGIRSEGLFGGAGRDVLEDGGRVLSTDPRDYLDGGTGDDIYILRGDAILVEQAGGGTDTVQIAYFADHTLGAQVENLTLLTWAEGAAGTGNALANVMTGNAWDNLLRGMEGNDTLSGAGGNDTVNGGSGADRISGGAGNDVLQGATGDDVLSGAAGMDTLLGGAGADALTGGLDRDVFLFDRAGDLGIGRLRDTITDFATGIDRLHLARLQDDQVFVGAAGFSGVAGQIRYVASSGLMIGDLDGDRLADWQIGFGAGTVVGAGDLIL